jgi:hypothetical protein
VQFDRLEHLDHLPHAVPVGVVSSCTIGSSLVTSSCTTGRLGHFGYVGDVVMKERRRADDFLSASLSTSTTSTLWHFDHFDQFDIVDDVGDRDGIMIFGWLTLDDLLVHCDRFGRFDIIYLAAGYHNI